MLECVLFCALEDCIDINTTSILETLDWKLESADCRTKRQNPKSLGPSKCASPIFDLSLTLNWEKAREDFDISLSIYQLFVISLRQFFLKVVASMPHNTLGEETVLSKQFICLLPDTHKVCVEEIFQSFKSLLQDSLFPSQAKRKMLLLGIEYRHAKC